MNVNLVHFSSFMNVAHIWLIFLPNFSSWTWVNVAHIFGEHELKFKFILSSFKDLKNSQFWILLHFICYFFMPRCIKQLFFSKTENRQMINLNFRVIFGQIFRRHSLNCCGFFNIKISKSILLGNWQQILKTKIYKWPICSTIYFLSRNQHVETKKKFLTSLWKAALNLLDQ